MDIGNASIANSGNKSIRSKEQWTKMLIILIIISLSIFYFCFYNKKRFYIIRPKISWDHQLSRLNLFERKKFK